MTQPPAIARVAYLSEPEPGSIVLNLQIDDQPFQRVTVRPSELVNMVADGARMLRDAYTRAGR